jgi:hypothetical protein
MIASTSAASSPLSFSTCTPDKFGQLAPSHLIRKDYTIAGRPKTVFGWPVPLPPSVLLASASTSRPTSPGPGSGSRSTIMDNLPTVASTNSPSIVVGVPANQSRRRSLSSLYRARPSSIALSESSVAGLRAPRNPKSEERPPSGMFRRISSSGSNRSIRPQACAMPSPREEEEEFLFPISERRRRSIAESGLSPTVYKKLGWKSLLRRVTQEQDEMQGSRSASAISDNST